MLFSLAARHLPAPAGLAPRGLASTCARPGACSPAAVAGPWLVGRAPLRSTAAAALAVLVASKQRGRTRAQHALVAALATDTKQETPRVAADGDAVLVHYEGRLEDGTVFGSTKDSKPLSFTIGRKQVVRGVEAAVRGLSAGDKASVTLAPELAYGERNEELVFDVGAENVPEGMEEGMSVALGIGGKRVQAKVAKIAEDGSVTLDANHALAGKTLTFDVELVGFRELLAPAEPPEGAELATFAAGCFWGVELAFQRVPGVLSTCVGYCQGHVEKPTYEDVCSAKTGHTEGVRVVFDPKQVTFEKLLETFWERVGKNATTLNVAGNDQGPQYRSGIYFHSEAQQQAADRSALALQMQLGERVVTEVQAAEPFWLAEDYHQQYLEKGGGSGNPQNAAKGCTDTIRCYG